MITLRKQVPLHKVKVYVPDDAGVRWAPIPHTVLLDEIRSRGKERGWYVSEPDAAFNKSRAWMAASFRIRPKAGQPEIPGMTWSLGVFNANDRRRSLAVYAGVIDRETGLSYVLAKTEEGVSHQCVDMTETSVWVVEGWESTLPQLPQVVADLKARVLGKDEWAGILFECCRKPALSAFPWRKLKYVDEAYRKAKDRTAWGLYTAVSKVVKTLPPMKQLDVLARVVDTLPS